MGVASIYIVIRGSVMKRGGLLRLKKIKGVEEVRDLINFESMEWRTEVIEENFCERDKRCILSISLSLRVGCDELVWAYSEDGTYTV